MCGICGIYEPGSQAVANQAVLKRMADTIEHRGPDAEGFYTAAGVGLAHRRLAIIDVASGQQPLSNEDGSVWTVFNGEIYNFQELNQQFLSSGHTFKTRSDTETIVHLYEELGDKCFEQMRGMFAIALWDSRRKRLVLARDRVGKKPVYYAWDGKRLVFGSEIKALWPAGGIGDDMDVEAFADYFSYKYVPEPKTIYKHIRKLRAGHYMVVDQAGLREVPYWDIRFDEVETELSEGEWMERLMAEFRVAVKSRLISEVPLGAFLSGGVDSSAVVALMSEVQPGVTTCSIGFNEVKYDEAEQARAFAQSVGARHHEHTVEPQAMELLPKLAWHYDEPFADSSAVPTYHVSRVAREHVTVALSGDGGDENFAGYRRYKLTIREEHVRSYVPAAARTALFGPLGKYYPKLGWAPRVFRAKSTFQSLSHDLVTGYFHGISCCPPDLKPMLLGGDVLRQLRGYDSADVLRGYASRCTSPDPLSRIQYADIKTYLVDDILTKVDRASMANSLEVRSPLLDHKVMELAARMPSSMKLKNGEGKYILKKALHGIVPHDTLYRPKKGFAMPVPDWFRGPLGDWTESRLTSGSDDGLLNRIFLQRCLRQHRRGQCDWSALLWTALMFRTWQEHGRRTP